MINVKSQPHYAFITRLLIDLYTSGELPTIQAIHIEPQFGHVGRIVYHNGDIRLFRGGRTGINAHSATLTARDKGYSKYFMRLLGYETADWQTFVTDDYANRINESLNMKGFEVKERANTVYDYIDTVLCYPCYVKPNDSSQGKGVFKCYDASDVAKAIDYFNAEKIDVFIVERETPYPDYRVVAYNGQVIACYARTPFQIVGNGRDTIQALIEKARVQFHVIGRKVSIHANDRRIQQKLKFAHLTLHDVLKNGHEVILQDVANLSLGGGMADMTETLAPYWKQLCVQLTHDMGLNLCGVDLACEDITTKHSAYHIIEINAAPGMENYAAMGAKQLGKVRQLYSDIFRHKLSINQA